MPLAFLFLKGCFSHRMLLMKGNSALELPTPVGVMAMGLGISPTWQVVEEGCGSLPASLWVPVIKAERYGGLGQLAHVPC